MPLSPGTPAVEVFARRCQDRGLLYRMPHIVSAATRGYGDRQLSFFS